MSEQREMTLDEWVNRLPEFHLANKQYQQLQQRIDELEQTLRDLGYCTDCNSIQEHYLDEPFSSCNCGTTEDYATRPLQKAQFVQRRNNELAAMVEQLRDALRHLHHNAKASGAEMGLALDVAEEALQSTPQQSLAERDVEVLLKLANFMEEGFGMPMTMGCDEVREYAQRIKEGDNKC